MLQTKRQKSQGLFPGRSKRFFSTAKHPERLWGPPSIQLNGYWGLFPPVRKSGLGVFVTTQLHLAPRLRMSGAIPALPHTPSWRAHGQLHFYVILNIFPRYVTTKGVRLTTPPVQSIRTDCGVCRWPWQWSAERKGDRPWFVTSNRHIPVKNTFGWRAAVFCACEIIQLFSVAFYLVRAVLKFNFRLVTNERKKLRHAVVQTHFFWEDPYGFPPTVVASVKGLYPRCGGQLHSLA
jgi:hypothetical protein